MFDAIEVYIDESGDLGFSSRSSRHFVVVALASPEPKELTRILRRVRRRLYSSCAKTPEFKFKSSPDRAKRLILRGLAGSSTSVSWGGVTKNRISVDLMDDKNALYLQVCSRTVEGLMGQTRAKRAHIVLDKWSSNRTLRRNFEEHLRETVRSHHGGYFAPSTSVSHLDSANSAGIQIADIVAGAVFRSLERADPAYIDIIAQRVVHGELYC